MKYYFKNNIEKKDKLFGGGWIPKPHPQHAPDYNNFIHYL